MIVHRTISDAQYNLHSHNNFAHLVKIFLFSYRSFLYTVLYLKHNPQLLIKF